MTPAARIAIAAELLDAVLEGTAAEKALTTWARKSRYAGSGDRAAVRDLVFDALRRKRSLAWLGGGETGRGLMIGLLRERGDDPQAYFTGEGHAPSRLTDLEAAAGNSLDNAEKAVSLDAPDWLWPSLQADLGPDCDAILSIMRQRAPVFLRANRLRTTREAAIVALAAEDITSVAHPLSASAIEVTGNPRRIQNSNAFREGLVELQDASSQAVVDCLAPHALNKSVLDYCAGGGGKSLALAAAGAARVAAHDADPARMSDLPDRANRAGADIEVLDRAEGTFDLVLADAPCSGSGAWRRQPDAKWRLTPDALNALNQTQDSILDAAARHVATGGVLAYATCSMLACENAERVAAFTRRNPEWAEVFHRQFTPLEGGDGFFVSLISRHP